MSSKCACRLSLCPCTSATTMTRAFPGQLLPLLHGPQNEVRCSPLSLSYREEAKLERPTAWSKARSQTQPGLPNPQLTQGCTSRKNKWSLGLGGACYSALANSYNMPDSGKVVISPKMTIKIRKQNGKYSVGARFSEDDERWPQWKNDLGVKYEGGKGTS